MADPAAPAGLAACLSDDDVATLLTHFDKLVERLEASSEEGAAIALEAIECLAEIYGTALARIVGLAPADGVTVKAMAGDELVGHLLMLHGLHPDSAADRIKRTLDEIRPHLGNDAQVSLTSINDGVAHLTLTAAGCASSAQSTAAAIGDLVLTAAPELSGVDTVPTRAPSLIPAESLLRRPGRGP